MNCCSVTWNAASGIMLRSPTCSARTSWPRTSSRVRTVCPSRRNSRNVGNDECSTSGISAHLNYTRATEPKVRIQRQSSPTRRYNYCCPSKPVTRMSFSLFNPLVREWFAAALGEPTVAQHRGWESIARGRHTLIAAPTGSGKTLAAFLSAINDLLEEGLHGPLPDEVRVLYVSPLK